LVLAPRTTSFASSRSRGERVVASRRRSSSRSSSPRRSARARPRRSRLAPKRAARSPLALEGLVAEDEELSSLELDLADVGPARADLDHQIAVPTPRAGPAGQARHRQGSAGQVVLCRFDGEEDQDLLAVVLSHGLSRRGALTPRRGRRPDRCRGRPRGAPPRSAARRRGSRRSRRARACPSPPLPEGAPRAPSEARS
jgi:hypothetical protein